MNREAPFQPRDVASKGPLRSHSCPREQRAMARLLKAGGFGGPIRLSGGHAEPMVSSGEKERLELQRRPR